MNASRVRMLPTGASVRRVLVVVAALGGLFAMHGLSDHGMGVPDAVMAIEGSTSMALGGDAANVAGQGSGMAVEADPPGGQPMEDHHGMGLAGLCMAFLVAVLLIGVSAGRHGLRPLRVWLPLWRPTRLHLSRPGPLRPPDLLALSIQRC